MTSNWVKRILHVGVTLLSIGALPQLAHADAETDYNKARTYFDSGEYSKAATWLGRAVAQGHSAARLPLAAMYLDGMGVEQDPNKAVEMFTISAREGYPSAQFTLGAIYRAGEIVERDYGEAMAWFLKAARQGEVASQNNLGTMFEAGRGTQANAVTALMWYEIAEVNGSERGRHNYKRLKRKLSEDEQMLAKKQAQVCVSSLYNNCGGR